MTIADISAAQAAQAAAQTSSSSNSGNALAQLSGNYQTFLTLLTTQLQNQDPTNPMDSSQFTQQLVSMSGVEQQIQTNTNLQALLSANIFQAANTAVGLIGKQVTATGSGALLQNGSASWTINLGSPAPSTTVQVLNANGATVYSSTINGTTGDQPYTWNGQDQSGYTLPDGTYYLQVTANDASGNAVTSSIKTQGIVTAVDITSSNPVITVNGAQIKYSDVTNVTAAPSS
ncbi:MAG: flagellar hook capping FlgD N-terminal domain-containing protein [Parvibaculum sp.]|uniref:flagellar hook assembly protein FlgD n=1 Tax=Parvibaculum sp. TaxID=2024848 RepID=UPI002851A1FE|nr:flagellar hook capping FlgD N-terminal domain-containing protein [Parvibaculum sp.]MDR3498958.1 flagellar hook capping FlgD N-terminal domain-containing protein [Parvibaculum sp.]